jgi:subtilisin-like proprotein convertase family protein
MTQRADRQLHGRRRGGARWSKATAPGVVALVLTALLWVAPPPAGADVVTGSNTAAIAVPAGGTTAGVASPYPSPITISGMAGAVSDVNVTLTSFSHAIASDVDVLLVGPGNQSIVLMSDAKGNTGFPLNNATLTFDDSAAAQIPATGAQGSGTFLPTNRDDASGPDTFPAPAPAPSSATTLAAAFNGTAPNGTWRLFAVDDASGDTGSIAGGWSITVTSLVATQPGAIQFSTTSFRGAEGGGPVSLTLERVGGDDGAVSVTVTTTTPATATPGVDFTTLNQTVNFADGQTTASVPLTILNDTAVEGIDETVTVALSNPGGGATVGAPSSAVVSIDDNDATFDATPIVIPGTGSGSNAAPTPSAPYPASIHVTGQPSGIGGVTVTLNNLSHTVPIDIDVLLAGPGGQNVVLMSDVGGQNAASNVTLTFSDAGASTIPAGGPLASGTFRVSDDDSVGNDSFAAPAPTPSTATSLAAFADTNPNGVWNLFVVDDASGDVGQIANGWSLTFLPQVIADAGGPYPVGEGSPLTLDGTGSQTPAGATFAWDVDNDGQFDDATGANPTLSAAALAALGFGDGPAGPATVGLRVTAGATVKTDTATLTITNVAPTASVVSVPAAVVAGLPATLTFGAADPAAADTAAGFTYRITWGDGTAVQSVTGGTSVDVSHTWATAGSFTVSVTATDKDAGVSAAATATVGVAPVVVADSGGPYVIDEGEDLVLDASGSSAGPTATYAWDLDGDGQFDDATGVNPTVPFATLAALGVGDGPTGPMTIAVQVTEGPSVDTDLGTLAVDNAAPTASVTVPAGIVAGSQATFTFSATDPSPADQAAGFTYAIDWGDGTSVQPVTGGASVGVAHTYATAGTFTVSVTATDKDAATSAAATGSVPVAPLVIADAGGPYDIAEGETLVLDGTGSTAGAGATFTWDVDGDGQFDDATGALTSLSFVQLAALGLGDGPASATISLQVTEGPSVDVDDATLAITNAVPTASVGTVPAGIVAGSPATFTFSATDASPADEAAGFTYAIDWGDGTSVQPVTGGGSVDVAHTYATAATFTVSVTATDKDGGTSVAATATATVVPLVIADAGGPYTIAEGGTLALDATGSTAGAGATFAWDVDGDGQFDDATGALTSLSFAQLVALGLDDGPASGTVSLQVTEGPSVDVDSAALTLDNAAPTASMGTVPAGIVAGSPATFTFSATDASPADQAAGFTYAIDWGDGTSVQPVTGGASVSVAHTYATAGTFTVSVTATDKDGGTSAAATATATVVPLVIADAGGPYTVAEGDDLALDGSGSTAGPTATFAWDVDGDGQFDDATGPTPTVTAAALAGLGLGDGPATAAVSLHVTEGPSVDTDDAALTVTNAVPTASVTAPAGVVEGTPATFTFAATDPAAADQAAGFTYVIDWGDGTAVQPVTGGASVSVDHTFASDGTFTVSVTATDKDGGTSAAATASVAVVPLVIADAGGPYTVTEGGTLALDGTGSTAGAGATFAWDVDGDGQFDDAAGALTSLSFAQLVALGPDDGPASGIVSLQVTEGPSVDSDDATLTLTNAPPVASVDSVPGGIVAGSAASFGFSAADPSPVDQAAGFTYAIDWGDGTPGQPVTGGAAVTVDHTYAAAGTFTLSVTATDKDAGTSAAATASVAVAPLVIADAGGPYTVAEGGTLALDGTGSTAGAAATFAWDVDGDGQFDDATGPLASVSFADLVALGLDDGPATGTVALQVTEGPSVDSDDAALTLDNAPPVASVDTVPAVIVAGISASFGFSAADPSPVDQAAGFTYAIDWGDGTPVQPVSGGAAVTVDHTYAAAGTFTLSVTATDKDAGTSAAATATADVLAAPPVVVPDAGGPYELAEGGDLALDATGTSAGPSAVYEWDLDGDGQFDDATGATVTLTPDELDPLGLADGPAGPLTLTLRVTEGPTVGTATATYSITNVAPTATVDLPAGGIVAGVAATVKVGADDPSPTDMAADFEYRIDWEGDGTVDDTVTGPADPPVTHTYATTGDVGLSVIAVDKDGAASSPTVTSVTVEPGQTPQTTGGGGGAGGGGSGLPRTGADTATSLAVATTLVLSGALLAATARLLRRRRRA